MKRHPSKRHGFATFMIWFAMSWAARAQREIPPAFGPHVNLKPADFAGAKSYRSSDRIVGTYYFYWYDAPSKAHIIDGDGTDALTTHPPTLEGLSWKSAVWHRRQLEDMMAAGIDVVLPVFWGAPSEQSAKAHLHWSYEEQWLKLLRRPVKFVMVETWNEWHEGTDVAESREYGRRYIDLTRKYSALFKQGWRPPWPKGFYSDAKAVTITLGATNRGAGLRQIENEDGVTTPAEFGGRPARAAKSAPGQGRYVYFAVDDSFKASEATAFKVEVEFFDVAPGRLSIEFDGSDESAPLSGAYTRAPESVNLAGTKSWRKATFTLNDTKFTNAQNRGADFRLVVETPEFGVGKVTLGR